MYFFLWLLKLKKRLIGDNELVDTVFSVILGVFEVISSDVVVDEAEEDKVVDVVDNEVTVVLGEPEVEN